MQRLALLTTITVTATIMSVLIPYQTAHAFPCAGGSGKDYCSGYHKGAVQADKDDSNAGKVQDGGNIFSSTCQSGHTADYCSGWNRGYNDEAGVLH